MSISHKHLGAATAFLLCGSITLLATASDADIELLRSFLLGHSTIINDTQYDQDGNGKLNAVDLTLMKRQRLVQNSDDWKLVWSDEFDSDSIDTDKWGFENGNWLLNESGALESYGWGNNEKQFYTPNNAAVSNGILTISAKKEPYTDDVQGTYDYTSARMTTKQHFSVCGGRIEVRARVDSGKSLWPAIWMLPENTVYGKWAASGEIDIMEGWGSTPEKICGTIHFGDTWPNNTYLTKDYIFHDGDSTEQWHTYAVEWDASAIRWYVDDICFSAQTEWYSNGRAFPAPFDQNFYILLNLAVGGNFDGINGTDADPSIFANGPKQMQVDYVRVYQKPNSTFEPSKLAAPTLTGYIEGADADLKNTDDGSTLTIRSVGTLEYSVLAYLAKQPVKADQKYQLSFTCTSSVPRTMRITLENTDYQRYFDELVSISTEQKLFSYMISIPANIDADIKFQLGCTEGAEQLPQHTVFISDLKFDSIE